MMIESLPYYALVLVFDANSKDAKSLYEGYGLRDLSMEDAICQFILWKGSVFYNPDEDEDNVSKGARTLLVFGNTVLIYGIEKEQVYDAMVEDFPNTHFLIFNARDLIGALTPEMYAFFLEDNQNLRLGSAPGIIIRRT